MLWDRPRLVAASTAVLFALAGARPSGAQSKAPPAKPAPAAGGGAAVASAKIQKPKARTVTGGWCRILSGGTFSGSWGPSQLPPLAFTIGAGPMADMMHANKAPFTGPGRYKDEIIALYLGKTAREDAYLGLGTIIVNPDGQSGSFALNDGSASGTWNCGHAPVR